METSIFDNMTYEELRIACAEKCGWFMNMGVKGDEGWWAVSPNGKCHYRNASYYEVQNKFYPDYKKDAEALLALMKKVWEKEPNADIGSLLLTVTGGYCIRCAWWKIEGGTVPIVIMKAFLYITEIEKSKGCNNA